MNEEMFGKNVLQLLFTIAIFSSSAGCIAVTSAEDDSAETTQYLILQGPDDGEHLKKSYSCVLFISLFVAAYNLYKTFLGHFV